MNGINSLRADDQVLLWVHSQNITQRMTEIVFIVALFFVDKDSKERNRNYIVRKKGEWNTTEAKIKHVFSA